MTDTAKTEALEQLMTRLEDGRPDPDEQAELWKESERCYHARRQEANLEAWRDFHMDQAGRIERMAASLAQEHRERAARLEGGGGAR